MELADPVARSDHGPSAPSGGDLAGAAFRKHYSRILRYARRRTTSESDAEEIAQEVFADASSGLDRVRSSSRDDGEGSVLPWLYTVARRRLADASRLRERSVRAVPLDSLAEVAAPPAEYGINAARILRSAFGELDEKQRSVVVMKLAETHLAGRLTCICAFSDLSECPTLHQLHDDYASLLFVELTKCATKNPGGVDPVFGRLRRHLSQRVKGHSPY